MTLAFLALLGAPYIYIYDISSLRVNYAYLGYFRGTLDRTMCPELDSASESEYQGFLLR